MRSLLRFCAQTTLSSGLLFFLLLFTVNANAQSNHTVSFSGSTSDFNAAEKISAAAGNTDYYITFDASNLYIAAFRTSGSFGTTDNLTIYLDTDPNAAPTSGSGTTAGQNYNGVTGTLPFSANYNVHAEQSFQEARSDAGSWASTIGGVSYNTGSTWREVAIPFSVIGNPDALYISMWMGQTGAIYSNAPGADLGGVANPTLTSYIGGFGVSSADCIPVNTTNTAITASITNAVPAAGAVYGKVTISSASITATNNFNIAAGGSIQVSGGSFDVSGRTISLGGSIGSGKGTTVNYTGGTLTTSAASNMTFNGEGRFTGNALTYEGALIINRKLVPLNSGGTTLGTAASVDMRSGSSINTNSLTYASGSTLMYNTGGTHTASLDWISGATSGTGVPSHVVIGNNVGGSVLSFGTSAAYRHANGNVIVSNTTSSNGLTLSSVSGGDLNLTEDFTQNGTFTHNNRSVTFAGTSPQVITGSLNTSGATNNFRSLILNNNGGSVTLNTNAKITATSGDVLQLMNNGALNIGSGVTLTLEGNGGAILTSGGTRTIHFVASSSLMSFTGTKTISAASGGTLSYTSAAANGTVQLSAAVNFGNLLTTIGNNTYLEILSSGSVSTNPPTYASGSTLVYNMGGTYTAATEWASNTTSGSGVPSNVLIGNGNNTTLSFGTSALFRHANRDVTTSASSGLTLSTVSGGDLQLRGDFAQNGTFTHNNRLVTFNGTSAQAISGSLNTSGATNNFAYLAINNTSTGVTLNNDVLVSQTTGDVLQLLNSGPLNVAATRTLTLAGTGGNIRVTGGVRTINFNAASSIMSITGAKTVAATTGGTLSYTSTSANGTLKISAGINFGASLTTIGNNTYLQIDPSGSVNTNAPTYATGSTLVYNAGGTVTVGTEWTINATSGVGVPHHVMIGNGTNTTLSFAATVQFRHANGDATISPSSALTLSSAAGGNLQLRGDFNNSGTFTNNGRDVTFNGTSGQQQLTGASTFQNMILNNTNGLLLNNSITVSNVLTLTAGSITLGSNNITLSNPATGAITGTFSSTRMIITNGSGQLIRAIATGGVPITYNFPVGETTGSTEYSPASFVFSANGIARNIGVRVIDGDHPSVNSSPSQTDYISRYWATSNSAASTYTYTSSFTFAAADLNGSEANIRANMWNGSAWNHVLTSTSVSNTMSITSGASNTTVPLGATAEFTGRVNNGSTYVWQPTTGTNSFVTAANWLPNRTTPAINDILVFSNGGTPTVNAVPTQTIGQLMISGGTVATFLPGGSNTLTIAGGNGLDFSIGATSTLQFNSGTALVLAFANSTTGTIDGTFALSSTVGNAFDCTNSVITVNGSINSAGTVTSTTSNLSFSSTGIYRHNYTTSAGTIPAATWNAAATCLIQGYTTGGGADFTPGGLAQTFGNFTWNCPSQSNNAQLDGNLTSIAGNFTITSANGQDIRLADASSMTLNIGGNLSLASNGTELRFSQNNGAHTVQVNVTGSYSQSNTSVLNLTNGNGSSAGVLCVAGTFNFSAGTITQTSGSTNAGNRIEFNGSSSQAVTISGTISNEINFRLDNTVGMTLSGTIPIISGCTFYRKTGAITGGTISYSSTGSTLVYEGTTAMTTGVEFPSSNGPEDVTVNSTNTISLAASRSLPTGGTFTNTSGIFSLGSFDLTLNNSATSALVNASPSATNMIAAGGSGQLRRSIATGANTYLFPIGDVTGTAEYSGVSMAFSANSTSRILGYRVADGFNVNDSTALLPSIDYTSRTWFTTLSVTSGTYTYTPTFSYNAAGDVYGTENNMLVSNWTGAVWVSRGSLVSAGSPTSTIATTAGVTQATLSLNNAEIMGRAPIKYWAGTTNNQWSTGTNWVPTGVPTSTDNIDVSFYTTFPCVLSSGSVTINHLTLSGTGDFTLSSGATLTVAGNFTYDNPASAVFSCGSTFILNNSVYPQTIPAVNFGHLNVSGGTRVLASSGTIGICNDYTPTAGTLTSAGSSVNFNGTTAQAILTNATSFADLTISNTSANVSSAANVTVNNNMQVNANARFDKTANTLTIGGAASANIDGYLRNSGTVTPTGSLIIKPTGTYEHNYTTTAGVIPTATWNTGSTCLIMGYTSNTTAPTGIGQAFHHFTWNCANQTGNFVLNAGLTTVNGDLSIINTNSGELRFTGGTSVTLNIGGNWNHSGGDITLVTGNGSLTIDVGGDYIQTGGYMDFTSSNNGDATYFITGNYSRTGSGQLTTTGLSNNGQFRFDGTNQTITDNSSGSNDWTDYVITNGSTTTLLTDLDLDGSTGFVSTMTIQSGGTLICGTNVMAGISGTRVNVATGSTIKTANTGGLMASASSGTVQTSTRTYSSGASYEYNGTSNQVTGDFWTGTSTANTVASLTINNTATAVTMNSGTNVTVTSGLNFSASNTANLDVSAQTIYVSNAATTAVSRPNVGHVIGNLRRAFNSGTNTYEFQIGTSAGYTPATLAMTASAAGSCTAKSTDGTHPNMATDGMSQTSYVNRYWTITYNSGNFTTNASSFTYLTSDLVGGATAASLRLKRYNAGWTAPTFTSTTNVLTGTSLTNTTSFGDFFAASDCSGYVAAITPGGSTTFCNGGSVSLVASANITGSTYSWSPATGLSATTGATVTANPTGTTTYTVTATSPQNCVDTEVVTVTVNARPTGVISGTTTICNGGSTTLSIAVTGTGPWSGTLSSGAAISGATSPLAVSVSPSTNTTYTIASLSDANCSSIAIDRTGSAIVTVNARPTGVISGTATICNGGSTTLSIAVTGTGPWSGTLSSGAAFSGASSPITVSVSPSTGTTYTIATLLDANCTALAGDKTGSAIVSVNARPTGVISGTTTICNGGSTTLSIAVTGAGPWSGTLSSGASISGASSPLTISVSPSSNTTYTIATLSDANCSSLAGDLSGSAVVSVNARPTGVISGTTTICNAGSATLSIAVTGTGPWSGTLSSGAAFSGASSPITVSVSPSTATTYTIATLLDANCTALAGDKTGSAIVSVNARPTGVISGTATICNGGSTTLSIAVTGTGPWSGTLSSGAAFSGASSPITVSVSPSTGTTYTIATLLDANCTALAGDKTGSAIVSVNTRPTGVLGGSQTICAGSSAPLFINVTGSGTISGTLSPGAIAFSGTAPTIFPTVTPGANTTYTIATLSDANCSSIGGDLSGSAAIVVHALPTAGISGSTTVCDGSSSTISFTGTPDAVVTYTKNGGSNQFITLDGSGNASLNSGPVFFNHTYALVSVNDGTCPNTASGTAVLTHADVPEAAVFGSVSICGGSSTTISFNGDPAAVITYTVNGGANQFITLSGGGTASFNTGALGATTTYLLVSVSNGSCSQVIGMSAVVTIIGNTYYQDFDGDGFGNPSVSTIACTTPVGYVANNTDCCDTNADINPSTEWWADVDGDGVGGFLYDNGCLSGVTCVSGTWPAQTIPYYPAAHGGASYVADCNDNNATIQVCGGPVNDHWTNAIVVNVTNSNAIYPNCLIYNGALTNATISSQSNSSNVAVGGGRDVWYKFTAPSNAVQIKVTPSGFDAVVELQNSSAAQLDAENINTVVGGLEIMNFTSLTVGNTYWVAIRNYHATNTGTFTLCVSPLMPSGCAYVTPVGGFSLCDNYKALYKGANSYTFRFTGTGGAAAFPYAMTSGTTSGLIPMSNPALDLRYGGIYTVRVDANYNVVNGLGASEPTITVLGNVATINCTGVSIIAAPTLEVKLAQRCPASLIRTQYLIGTPISGSPNACTASNYSFEFTPVTDCTGSTTLGLPAPFTVNSTGNTPYLMLTAAFPTPLANNGFWKVRIRPNFSYGSGAYGPTQVIQVTGSSTSQMLEEPQLSDDTDRSLNVEEVESAIYPNPNNGEMLNLNLTGLTKGNVYIRVTDAIGRTVYQDMMFTEGTLNAVVTFTQALRGGLYHVEFTNDGKTYTERLLIEK